MKNRKRREFHQLSNIDTVSRVADCGKCGLVKIVPHTKDKKSWRCYPSSRDRLRLWKKKKRQEKKNMLQDQCQICGKKEGKLCWDHKHNTKIVVWDSIKYNPSEFRGTLCNNCNLAIGLFHDDPKLCYRAYKYLSSSLK